MIKKNTATSVELVQAIVNSIQDKKGEQILSMNLSKLPHAVCQYFIICHAESTVQVRAIAEWIYKNVKEKLHESVWAKEGFDNAQWIILDYANVVVHIFQKPYRDYYRLEELWADAEIDKIAG